MPLVSVVVPVYKAENALHRCVNSILDQSFSDFELILVDDGSPDNSGKICDKFAEGDSRVKVIHKENGGVSSARNAGIKFAEGTYLCFVDSDDYLEKDYLSKMLEIKQKYAECDNIWCGVKRIIDDKSDAVCNYRYSSEDEISHTTRREIMTLMEMMLEPSPFNKLFSRKIIVDNNLLMDESLSLGEDAIFNLDYLDCTDGKIIVVNCSLYNYIFHQSGSLITKYYKKPLDIHLKIYNTFMHYIDKWGADESQRIKNINSMIYRYEYVLNNTFDSRNTESFTEKLRYNKSILNSEEFKYVLSNCTCELSKGFYFLCKHKLSLLLYLQLEVRNIKIRLRSKAKL